MKTLLYVSVFVVLLGCKKDSCIEYVPNQKVLFQIAYQNVAWGLQHDGSLIDSAGVVHCYHLPNNWNFCDEEGYISESDMNANLLAADDVCCQLDKEVVRAMSLLINGASKGPWTEPEQMMYDAGIRAVAAFEYDAVLKRYKYILLSQDGDVEVVNTSKQAKALTEWLISACLID